MRIVFDARIEAAKMKPSAGPAMVKYFVVRLQVLFDSFSHGNIGQFYFVILSDSVFLVGWLCCQIIRGGSLAELPLSVNLHFFQCISILFHKFNVYIQAFNAPNQCPSLSKFFDPSLRADFSI